MPGASTLTLPKKTTRLTRLALAVLAACGTLRVIGSELPVPCIGTNCAGGPSVWVTGGQATANVSNNRFTVNQSSDRAILNWASFNVGSGGEVVFAQPSATSVALNRIFQQDPSVILGAVSANGQVYLINSNGLVFGEGARVNVGSLIASTLDVDDNVFNSTGVVSAINNNGAPAFETSNPDASIQIEAGAEMIAGGGGRIVILAPEVVNRGEIRTPDGQAVLAASEDRVYLVASDDPTLRGLIVEVDTGGDVTNIGDIVAERGNVTIAGLAVNQEGRVSATTSVRANGSVRLLARDGAEPIIQGGQFVDLVTNSTGVVTLGENSVTEVLPDPGDDSLAIDEQIQSRSTVTLFGRQIVFESQAEVVATSGDVEIIATENPRNPLTASDPNSAQIFLAQGSRIDVSGDDSTVLPMERNVVEVELRGNELADAPLQRDSVIRGEAVRIDRRVGTPLANVDASLSALERGLPERLSTGGTVQLDSEGSVVISAGAQVDISGGQVAYQDGYMDTTQLVSEGMVVDIGQADPNVRYTGIATGYVKFHERWGITETFDEIGSSEGRFEAGYLEGKDAGTLSIIASDILFSGTLTSDTVVGVYQRQPGSVGAGIARPFDQLPDAGHVTFDFTSALNARRNVVIGSGIPAIVAPGALLPIGREASVAPALVGGLSAFELRTLGDVHIGEDIRLELAAGASLGVDAASIDMAGSINAPAGQITLSTSTPNLSNAPITVRDTASLDVSGQYVNDVIDVELAARVPLWIDGGTIELDAGGDLIVAEGARLVANGGAWVDETSSVTAGRGGNVALSAERDLASSEFVFEGTLQADALEEGGTLSLNANQVSIVSHSQTTEEPFDEDGDSAGSELLLTDAFMASLGFSRYEVNANRQGLIVREGANLTLRQRTLELLGNYLQQPSLTTLPVAGQSVIRPRWQRTPVSLSLSSVQSSVGDPLSVPAALTIENGAVIDLDPQATVSMLSDTSLFVDGHIVAPDGAIDLIVTNVVGASVDPGYRADQQLRIGAGALLDVSGDSVLRPNDLGIREGTVVDGGRIAVTAQRGYVLVEDGASIDASATTAVLDIVRSESAGLTPTQVYSNAGAIDIVAADSIFLNGELLARDAGVDGSAGGTLSLSVSPSLRGVDSTNAALFPTFPLTDAVVRLSATDEQFVIGRTSPIPQQLIGQAVISQGQVANGGFSRLALSAPNYLDSITVLSRGVVELDRGVNLELDQAVSIAADQLLLSGGTAALSAPYVQLGSLQVRRAEAPELINGSGTLEVSGNTVDLLGLLTLQGINQFTVNATDAVRLGGGVEFDQGGELTGRLNTSGSLTLNATQLYPGTLSQFDFVLSGEQSEFALHSSSPADAVLSAGGAVRIAAADILIDGNVLAPFGQVEFVGGNGVEVTQNAFISVSGQDQNVLFGRTQGGIDWIYPLSSQRNLIFGSAETALPPPQRRIDIDAETIELNAGALLDVSGGGELLAYEFVPGPGGSQDILSLENASDGFAVLPTYAPVFAPLDPLESTGNNFVIGQQFVASAGSALPAGAYTILPARYALLEGAYLIQPISGSLDAVPNISLNDTDGIDIVTGRFAQTTLGSGSSEAVVDARWQSFRVLNTAQVRDRSEYTVSGANTFFEQRAIDTDTDVPLLPRDAGSLGFRVGSDASLRADILAQGAETDGRQGRGGQLDIAAGALSVVNALSGQPASDVPDTTAAESVVELLASDLNALTIESLLLGGVRTTSGAVETLSSTASSITIDDNVSLQLPELLFVADQITVSDGAAVTNTDAQLAARDQIIVDGGAAFLGVSSAEVFDYQRADASASQSSIVLGSASDVIAGQTLLLDAPGGLQSGGAISAADGTILLASNRIGLGLPGEDVSDINTLLLSDTKINALDSASLTLQSSAPIDVYGSIALDLERLELSSPGLVANSLVGDDTVDVQVDQLVFSNPASNDVFELFDSGGEPGSGELSLAARTVLFGDGSYGLAGFGTIELSASDSVRFAGVAELLLGSDTSIDTAGFVADTGAMLQISAVGRSVTIDSSAESAQTTSGLGARLDVTAGELDWNGRAWLPSGQVNLEADELTIGSDAVLDVAGSSVNFGSATEPLNVYSGGGMVSLIAMQGDLNLTAGGFIDVSGAADTDGAGSVLLSAGAGVLNAESTLTANGQGGDALIDAETIAQFSDLSSALETGGFTGVRSVRQREGDITLGLNDSVNVAAFELSTDSGNLFINGSVRSNGGDVYLAASDAIEVSGSIDTTGLESNGSLHLQTSGAQGRVDLAGQSSIVLGSTDIPGGELQVQLNELSGDVSTRLTSDGQIEGASNLVLLAASQVIAEDPTLGVDDLDAWLDQLDGMTDAVDANTLNNWLVRPVLEILANDDLTITGELDLVSRRYNEQPGTLVIRTPGNLTIDGSISDGVFQGVDLFGNPLGLLSDQASWSLQLVAGADITAINPLTMSGTGSLQLEDNTVLRTGTGDIELRAAGDIDIGDGATVYTSGVTTGAGTLPDILVDFIFSGVEYPERGGDISVVAGGDISATDSNQLVNNWLYRTGGGEDSVAPTLWGVLVDRFRQTFGTLGGGNIDLSAGGDIRNVSAAIATTAQHVGDATVLPNSTTIVTSDNSFIERGGGTLNVTSGGNVSAATLYAGRGQINVSAAADIGANSDGRSLILALGDAAANVQAVGNIEIDGILNPTVLPQSRDQISLELFESYFFTYGDETSVDVVSLAGDVVFDNDIDAVIDSSGLQFTGIGQTNAPLAVRINPADIQAAALTGDVVVENSLILFPRRNGNLNLLAYNDVRSGAAAATVSISDADPALLPSAQFPSTTLTDVGNRITRSGRGTASLIHAAVPLHIGDEPSRLIALTGSVTSPIRWTINSAEAMEVRAGLDVRNISLTTQNNQDSDVTLVSAGRDIIFPTPRNPVDGRVANQNARFEVAGPGRLDILAGRNIDLGSSDGVITLGDRTNSVLPDQGADVTLLAGLAQGADYAGFIDTYFSADGAYQTPLEDYVSALSGIPLFGQEALDVFTGLDVQDQRPLVIATFFAELRESGKESVDPELGFDRGFAAAQTLFPEDSEYKGDIRIFFSRVQTTDGGDINVLAPGGEVNAGLAAVFEGAKPASELGIVVQSEGDVNGFVLNDFLVNQSRVFALDGGDILLWSSTGDIDAGRGAKTALASPQPVVTVDIEGNIIVEFPPTISGSGIRASVSTADRDPGDVFLFAPAGVVNAGDAGIGSAGNITIAATEVVGADNIDVGGTAVGVPVDTGGVAAGLSAVSGTTAGATTSATEQVTDDEDSGASGDENQFGAAALAWLDVFLLGFGDDENGEGEPNND